MPQQYFVNVSYAVPEEQFDLAIAALNDFEVQGIEEKFDALLVSFLKDYWNEEVRQAIAEQFSLYGVDTNILSEEIIEQKNWNELWEQSLQPVVINERIVIAPDWAKLERTFPITLLINPKMSFGTGYHPTTRMTTRLLEEHMKPGSRWIDAGTGTGVLAIAAIKLGATSVYAFDNDEWSVENAEENILKNDTADAIRLEKADVFTVELPPADGIVANMYRNILIPVFPKFRDALQADGNPLIISGILKFDNEELVDEAQKAGFHHIHTEIEDEWSAMVFTRKG